METETVDGKVLSSEEINLIRKYRAKQDFDLGFYSGLIAARNHLESLANECCGGSGTGDTADTLRLAAKEVGKITAPKNTSMV